MEYLQCPVQRYAWGSTNALADLLGLEDDGTPRAELWMGAHPSAPATLGGASLDKVIASDPEATVGARCVERFGPRLPFLFKFLSAARPLSLQVHPTEAQAAGGYALEEADGVLIDAPNRRYRDPFHKPELLMALQPFTALCGFRPLTDAVELLYELGLDTHAAYRDLDSSGVKQAVARLLGNRVAPPTPDDLQPSERPEARWARRIAEEYPGDPGMGVSLLLNLLELEPGQGVYLPPGNPHAYLEGTGLEIMASSDNVLRAGMTPKFVDVDEVLQVLDFAPTVDPVVVPEVAGGLRTWRAPVDEFLLRSLDHDTLSIAGGLPTIALGLTGSTLARSDAGTKSLSRGQVLWIPASEPVTLQADGICAVASVNSVA